MFEWLTGHTGILAEYAPNRYGFLHLHFQEYLAARHADRQGEMYVKHLATELGLSRWEETIGMFAGLAQARSLQELLEHVAATDKLVAREELVRRCLEEAPEPPTEPLAEVIADRHRAPASRAAALRLARPYMGAKVRAAVAQAARDAVSGSELRLLAEATTGSITPAEPGISTAAVQQAFTEMRTEIRFLWVPGGTFTMGADDLGEECGPPHRVQLSPFWLAETPVTNWQYEKFLNQQRGENREPPYWRDRRFNQPEQPVVGVTWPEARTFCQWLSAVSGHRVELPTEAQWELAARGLESWPYPWGGEEPDERRAHFGQSWESGTPLPVGSRPAGQGPYGHQDLAGNVWEWCVDAWDARAYRKRRSLTINPFGADEPANGGAAGRACRGGGFGFLPRYLHSAFRLRLHPDEWNLCLGFRVAAFPAHS